MQGWEKCNEKPLPKRGFYSNLNIKYIIAKNISMEKELGENLE